MNKKQLRKFRVKVVGSAVGAGILTAVVVPTAPVVIPIAIGAGVGTIYGDKLLHKRKIRRKK